MDLTGLLIALLIGAIAGFLAGQIIKGHGFGIVGNIIVGIVGALIFGFLFGNFNLLNSPMLKRDCGRNDRCRHSSSCHRLYQKSNLMLSDFDKPVRFDAQAFLLPLP